MTADPLEKVEIANVIDWLLSHILTSEWVNNPYHRDSILGGENDRMMRKTHWFVSLKWTTSID